MKKIIFIKRWLWLLWMGSRWFLFIYFSPEGSVTSPPTQTSQALLAARGTEQESARLVKKKEKTGGNWRWSGEDEGRYSVWATFVHYRLLRGAARERRPHDGVRKRLGRSVPCESRRTHLCHLVLRCEVTDQRSTDWLKLDWEVWTSSNFFLSFFCSIFKEASPDPSPHVGLTSPSAKTEAGYLTSCCFLWEKILLPYTNALGNRKISPVAFVTLTYLFKSRVDISRKYSSFDYSNRFMLVQLYINVTTLRRLLFCLQIHWNYWLLVIAFGCFQIKLRYCTIG